EGSAATALSRLRANRISIKAAGDETSSRSNHAPIYACRSVSVTCGKGEPFGGKKLLNWRGGARAGRYHRPASLGQRLTLVGRARTDEEKMSAALMNERQKRAETVARELRQLGATVTNALPLPDGQNLRFWCSDYKKREVLTA